MKIDIEKLWYSKNILCVFLLPLSWVFRIASSIRRSYYNVFGSYVKLKNTRIIVVGNLTVGGAGKTPFVAYLAQSCLDKNLKVAIVSRGYGRDNENALIEVIEDSKVSEVGDEARMLKDQLSCPIVVAADRNKAAEYVTKKYMLEVIISDDGLQHYKLARDYEIIIVDGEREFGNGWCLPAGPLREPISRLQQADMVISNGENSHYEYQYTADYRAVISLCNNANSKDLEEFKSLQVHALAGIGYPKRFFTMLVNSGMQVIEHSFPDHHVFTASDLEFGDNLPIIMTEKDAVKCKHLNKENTWYLPITAVPNDKLQQRIDNLLEEIV